MVVLNNNNNNSDLKRHMPVLFRNYDWVLLIASLNDKNRIMSDYISDYICFNLPVV